MPYGDFANTKGWVLVNEFTIERGERKSSGRPFMLTRVPVRLHGTLHDLRAIAQIDWLGDHDIQSLEVDDEGALVEPETPRQAGHAPANRITARMALEDRVTVFSVESGAQHSFETIRDITIRPIDGDRIGGRWNANRSDGIHFSGWSAGKIPEKGLMEGEPGSIFVSTGDHLGRSAEEGGEDRVDLGASLFLGRDDFEALFCRVAANPGAISAVRVGLLADLFEEEVSAALSEPWHHREYGLLSVSEKSFTQTRARLDNIQVDFGAVGTAMPQDGDEAENDDWPEPVSAPQEPRRLAAADPWVGKMLRRLAWTNGLLVLLILVLLLK